MLKRTKIIIGIAFVISFLVLGYFAWPKIQNKPNGVACTQEAKLCPDGTYVGRTGLNCEFAVCSGAVSQLEYKNSEYGFAVALPESWRGYTVTIDKWTGYSVGDQLGEMAFADGPVVSIHNPKWTKEVIYQDIPIMVFSLGQWIDLQQDKFHIGAAPIGPSELGRNAKYIFALPARYNYAFPPGYEEVNQIIQSKPLRAF